MAKNYRAENMPGNQHLDADNHVMFLLQPVEKSQVGDRYSSKGVTVNIRGDFHTGASTKVAFVTSISNFEAKNHKCDDVYLEDKRRSSCDFAADLPAGRQEFEMRSRNGPLQRSLHPVYQIASKFPEVDRGIDPNGTASTNPFAVTAVCFTPDEKSVQSTRDAFAPLDYRVRIRPA